MTQLWWLVSHGALQTCLRVRKVFGLIMGELSG